MHIYSTCKILLLAFPTHSGHLSYFELSNFLLLSSLLSPIQFSLWFICIVTIGLGLTSYRYSQNIYFTWDGLDRQFHQIQIRKKNLFYKWCRISLFFSDDRFTFSTASSQNDGNYKYTALWQLLSVSHLSVTIQQSQENIEGHSCWLCSCYNLKLIFLNVGGGGIIP